MCDKIELKKISGVFEHFVKISKNILDIHGYSWIFLYYSGKKYPSLPVIHVEISKNG